MLFASLIMDLGLIMKLSVFLVMKRDNLVIGVSSIDFSVMKLGKRV